ncbi:putative WRKY transcription factor 62 [Panicum miliaceum]|uniref:WRKY transcription factor 62 n=1 Tax=Panicum miliaceum TaxID=4540 RepID=A0A3L6R7E7_PANMI|nr:putative WRKY transcription factor 62 [Panicum miliaceum]
MALTASTGRQAASMAFELMARGRQTAAALEALLQGALTDPTVPPHGGLQLNELAAQILRCCDRALEQEAKRFKRRYLLSADQLMTLLDASSAGSTNSIAGCVRAAQRCPQELRRGARRRTGSCGGSTGRRTSGTARVPKVRSLFSRFSRKMMVRRKTYCPVLRRCWQYFRCSYKYDNGCKAARQVQQSETNPSLYVVAYFGEHTCGKDAAAAALGGADDDKMQKSLVINFGCSSASSGSPWPSSSSFEDDV